MCHQESTFTDQLGGGARQAGVRLAATAQRRPTTSPEIRLHWVPRSSEAHYRITLWKNQQLWKGRKWIFALPLRLM